MVDKKIITKKLKDGEILFNEGDIATSLFIIQSGNLRAFLPKSKGNVEVALVRAGEMIGELSFFSKDDHKRDCSASAIGPVELIEIPFGDLDRIIQNNNPWIRILLNTIADRLRDTNKKIKQMASFSTSWDSQGSGKYVFFSLADVIKMLSTFHLVAETYGSPEEEKKEIFQKKLEYYFREVYSIPAVKFEEFIPLLVKEKIIEIGGNPGNKTIRLLRPYTLLTMVSFFSAQRSSPEDKRLSIGTNCQEFLNKILRQLESQDFGDLDRVKVDLSTIIKESEKKAPKVSETDLDDAVKAKLCEEIKIDDQQNLITYINYDKLKQLYPCIKMLNAIAAINKSKGSEKRY